ncbi:MAG TPA: MauE/DoxX family redox-associated membrane protein [Gaiellaceae bacterium]|nr:MauE/DoxX family redox-associated membrane protein [Gaiellaceae bacterium]
MTGDVVIEVMRLALAAMFAVAGVAKLADLSGATRAARDFGTPQRLALPLAICLACAEIAIAIGLLFAASARAGAAGGAALLIVLAAAVAVARLRGRTPDCHCFGRLHSAPAGWTAVVRNLALALSAALVASQPASGISTAALAALGIGVLVVGQALLSYTLVRRYGKALRQIEELETQGPRATLAIGSQAPDFSLEAAGGGVVTLGGLLSPGRPVLLVFADPQCGPCHALMPKISAWQHSLADELTLAVVSRGTREENLAVSTEHGLGNVLVQDDREVSESYGVWATPSALLIGADGRIEHAPVAGAEAIEQLAGALTPVERKTTAPKPERAQRELAAATAVVGGLALTAASAQASTATQEQQPTNAELQAIDGALKAAGPRIVAASQRSLKAVRAQATLKEGTTVRAKRKAARRALTAERREVLALQARVAKLAETSREAHNAKIVVDDCLSLLAKSLAKRQQAIGAAPKVALRLGDQGQELFLRSVGAGSAARELLGHGG